MSKSHKVPIRKITINDDVYCWVVNRYNCDGDGGCTFKIWKNKKQIWNEVIHSPTVITPKDVRCQILKIVDEILNSL